MRLLGVRSEKGGKKFILVPDGFVANFDLPHFIIGIIHRSAVGAQRSWNLQESIGYGSMPYTESCKHALVVGVGPASSKGVGQVIVVVIDPLARPVSDS